MTKQVIRYNTSGNLENVTKIYTEALQDCFDETIVERMKLFVDKERGIVRLTKRTVSGIYKRFLWVVSDHVLTGEISSTEQRREVVCHLYNKGLTQNEISDILNVSQSLVSKDLTPR